MISREELRALLIERAKEAGVYSDTLAFSQHIHHEVDDYLSDKDSDHKADLELMILRIREQNIRLGRVPYEGYPHA